MELRERRFLITGIFSILCVAAALIFLSMQYLNTIEEQTQRLVEDVQSRALYVERAFEHELEEERKFGLGAGLALIETLEQFDEAHPSFAKFGKTGEFQLAKLENGNIHFHLGHNPKDVKAPGLDQITAQELQPMKYALSQKSGTMIIPDYRGRMALTAYGPVKNLEVGIVAKIDVDEISKPFIILGSVVVAVFSLLMAIEVLFYTRGHAPE